MISSYPQVVININRNNNTNAIVATYNKKITICFIKLLIITKHLLRLILIIYLNIFFIYNAIARFIKIIKPIVKAVETITTEA